MTPEDRTLKRQQYLRDWRTKNPDKVRSYEAKRTKNGHYAKYYAANRDKEKARCALYRAQDKDRAKDKDLRKAFGITINDYKSLIEHQNYQCKVCETDLRLLRSSEVQVDHCHTSGVVRGILCGACNRALGHLKDNPRLARKLAEYSAEFIPRT